MLSHLILIMAHNDSYMFDYYPHFRVTISPSILRAIQFYVIVQVPLFHLIFSLDVFLSKTALLLIVTLK